MSELPGMDNQNFSIDPLSPSFRSGFVVVVGKPNVGKSTLINALVGTKVAITSPKPQTTRHRILGVKNGSDYQLVFVDTPGVHRPTHELGKFMEKTYRAEVREADAAILVVEATHMPTEEDERARDVLMKREHVNGPVFLVLSKIDVAKPDRIDEIRERAMALGPFDRMFEVSALKKKGLEELEDALAATLQPGPPFFPSYMKSDQPPEFTASEIVREKILMLTRQEIPHSVFVHTEDMAERPSGDLYFNIFIFVEKESQKGIVIGKDGELLKKVGTLAREELEFLFNKHVYLDLRVKVKEDWKDRRDLLKSWGYEV